MMIFRNFIRFFSKIVVPEMRILNVAEKNDAAKSIAAILSNGASSRREGLSKYNKIYEFKMELFNQNVLMIMTSVSGHLLNYEFSGEYQNWRTVDPISLFDAPIKKTCIKGMDKIQKTLVREIRTCNGLIIWTDCDREGENIGYEIIETCKSVQKNLSIYRAKFSEITYHSIHRAISNLQEPNRSISEAADVRQELDLRTGAIFTRLQTLRFQTIFADKLAKKVISYGSCQFPTLGFVIDRYKTIEDFIPEDFWKIRVEHVKNDLKVEFIWEKNRLFDKTACEVILDICKENPQAKVIFVDRKPKSKWRPVPLDTVQLEKSASKKLRINASETMKIAEKLYSKGFISYPRTETNIFPKEINLKKLVDLQTVDQNWGRFASDILNSENGPVPRQGKKSDKAHPPIHPTKYTNQLSGNDKKVYEFVVRHFLACCQKDAVGEETVVQIDINGEKFTAKGLNILQRNYLDIYPYEVWNAKQIHNYILNETFDPTILKLASGKTTAPSLLTESDLIALMEKFGIGTDATHAEHIEKIKSREYVVLKDNKFFVPTTLGLGLVEGYNQISLDISLAKPLLRSDFEEDLKAISENLKNPNIVKSEQIKKYKKAYQKVIENFEILKNSLGIRINQ